MTKAVLAWKKGRGKLGLLQPLIGGWQTSAETQLGHVEVERRFAWILGDAALQLDAYWRLPEGKSYREHAIFSADADGAVRFWSFTSDGKRSEGRLADGSDIHPEAIAFVAQMPAGIARTTYWPSDQPGFRWAVESETKKGWNRFMEHVFTPL